LRCLCRTDIVNESSLAHDAFTDQGPGLDVVCARHAKQVGALSTFLLFDKFVAFERD